MKRLHKSAAGSDTWRTPGCAHCQDAANFITTQSTRIIALEAALAAKDEALSECDEFFAGTDAVLEQKIINARALTPPEALAWREAERRVIEAAQQWKRIDPSSLTNASDDIARARTELRQALSALAALDQEKEEPHG